MKWKENKEKIRHVIRSNLEKRELIYRLLFSSDFFYWATLAVTLCMLLRLTEHLENMYVLVCRQKSYSTGFNDQKILNIYYYILKLADCSFIFRCIDCFQIHLNFILQILGFDLKGIRVNFTLTARCDDKLFNFSQRQKNCRIHMYFLRVKRFIRKTSCHFKMHDTYTKY